MTASVTLANAQTIEQSGGSLTLASGVTLSAEVSTYAGLNSTLANDSITSVKLTGNIRVDNGYTLNNLSKIDFNGYSIAPARMTGPSTWL